MTLADFVTQNATLIAVTLTCFVAFFNWRTAVAAKKSPLHDRLKETISHNKDFADRIADKLDMFFTDLIPRLIPPNQPPEPQQQRT